jgi:hypothetical protein
MKNPLSKLIHAYPNNKIEFVWKRDQLTHIIVDGKRAKLTGVIHSIFALMKDQGVSFDEEFYNILDMLVKEIINHKD